MGRDLKYSKTPSTTLHRLSKRGTYDLGAIHAIVNSASVLHVSWMPSPEDPFPATLPMIGQMGSFEYPSAGLEDPLDLYLHGWVSSRIMNNTRSSTEAAQPEGMPVTVAATHVDGLVLALTPFHHSFNYRSAILQGHATVVTDLEEKLYAMKLITNKVLANRWENSRTPPDNAAVTSTSILKVRIAAGSGKIRTGGPHDDAKDIENEDVGGKVWTGVVPVYETLGEPIACGDGRVARVPDYINEALQARIRDAEAYAKAAVTEP